MAFDSTYPATTKKVSEILAQLLGNDLYLKDNPDNKHGSAIFTLSGVWKCPKGVTRVNVLLIGGGGGGLSYTGHSTARAGTTGGTSSFGSLLSATGGTSATSDNRPSLAGTISGSSTVPYTWLQFNLGVPGSTSVRNASGNGGASGASYNTSSGDYCHGVYGGITAPTGCSSGGGCLYAVGVPVTEETEYTITVGAGGIHGDADTHPGGDGAPGICIIEW